MKLTNNEESEVKQVYDTWLHAYINGDINTYDYYFDNDYHFIGSTNNEEFLNRVDTTEFLRKTADQLAGKADLRNNHYTIEKFEGIVFLTHVFDAWFLNEEDWAYYGRFRFTSALKKNKEGWRFIYQHFSTPDANTEEGETIGFDRVNEENKELRLAIQRRTKELEDKNRELEIESALERIRSEALAMQKSSDLLDIVVTMRNQYIKLGHEAHYFWHMLYTPEKYEKAMTSGDGTKIGFVMNLPRHMHGDIPELAKWEKGKKPTVVYAMDTEEAIDYVDKMVELGDFKNIDPQAPTHDDIRHIGGLTFIMARTTHGEIGYSLPGVVKKPPKEDLNILVKFASAFDFAHKRFLDLQKAEKQTRETQIELALEKVRSHTMAMQGSNELTGVGELLYSELSKLGIKSLISGYVLMNDDGSYGYNYTVNPVDGSIRNEPSGFPLTETKPLKSLRKSWKNQESNLFIELDPEETIDHQTYIAENSTNFPIPKDKLLAITPERLVIQSFNFRQGFLLIVGGTRLTEEEATMVGRFSTAFDMAYRRFLDLKKAEERARENQIELALEKVRSRTMAMQKSDELNETAELMFQQIKELNIDLWSCGFSLWYDDDSYFIGYNPGPDGKLATPLTIPLTEDIFFKTIRESKRKGDEFLVFESKGESLKNTYQYMDTLPVVGETMRGFVEAGFPLPTYQVTHCGFFEDGHLMFITHEPNFEYVEIFKRFTKVFNQTYTRFLDLKKAEEQAREKAIELALEKVRSRTMAMQHSDELQEASYLLDQQVRELGIQTWGCAFNIYREKDSIEWFGNEQGVLPEYIIPREGIFKEYYEYGQQGKKVHVQEFVGKECITHYENMSKLPIIGDVLRELKKTNGSFPDYQIDHVIYHKHGYLLFITTEFVPESTHEIFRRFAKVFEQTYTRFLDLQKAEEQAREAKIEAALERVRSRSMAMQKSQEIGEVAFVLYQQLNSLGGELWGTGFAFCQPQSTVDEFWFANERGIMPHLIKIPNNEDEAHRKMYEGWKKNLDSFSIEKGGKELEEHYKYMLSVPDVKPIFQGMLDNGISFPKWQKWHAAYFKYGYLLAITTEAYENVDIFIRFAKVFEQAYTRFLDLQRAEAQAREAQIEAALERVRSRSMGMQKSDELKEAIQVVYDQMNSLDINVEHTGFIIDYPTRDDMHIWLADKNGVPLEVNLPYFDAPHWNSFIEAKKKGQNFFANQHDFRQKNAFYKKLFKVLPDVPEDVIKFYMEQPALTISTVLMDDVGLYMENFNAIPYTDEENKILKRFAKVFQQTYTRFRDLQRAEEQAREAKIEAALEKVRSRSMAMQNSVELSEAAEILYQEFFKLGITPFSCGYLINDEEEQQWNVWMTDANDESFKNFWTLPFKADSHLTKRYKSWEKMESFHQTVLKGNDNVEHHKIIAQFAPWKEASLDALPECLVLSSANFKHGHLLIVTAEELEEEVRVILTRFAKVFEQAYIRFLDLKMAEARAKEAQIEASLEKVRSCSLAMQSADELSEVVLVIVEKLKELNVILDANGITLCTYFPDSKDIQHWIASPDFSMVGKYLLPYFDHIILKEAWASKEDGDPYFSKAYSIEDKNSFFDHAFQHSDYKHFPEEFKNWIYQNDKHTLSFAWQKNSALLIPSNTGIEPSEEDRAILIRFSKVFEQAYIRFMDLQKADARAREAKIDAALEKVRSHAMSMQQSEEIKDVVGTIVKKVGELDIDMDGGVSLATLVEGSKDLIHWYVNPEHLDEPKRMYLPYFSCKVFDDFNEARQNNQELLSVVYNNKELTEYFQKAFEISEFSIIPEDFKKWVLNQDHFGYTVAMQDHAVIFFNDYSGKKFTSAENDILIRFSKVFEHAYTRFLDLKKAEERARETQIEVAVERVRNRTLAMQASDELSETSVVVFQQLMELGIDPNRLYIGIFEGKSGKIKAWATNEDGSKIIENFVLDSKRNKSVKKIYKGWNDGKKSITIDMKGKELKDYLNYLSKELKIPFKGGLEQNRRIQTVAYFSQGCLGVASQGDQSEETRKLLERFAEVFNLTYTRFNDLKISEAQAREAKIEAGLEKVRSRSLEMISSNEMQDVANELFYQMQNQGLEIDAVGMSGVMDATKDYQVWVGGSTFNKPLTIPFSETTQVQRDYNVINASRDELFSRTYKGKIKKEYIDFLLVNNKFPKKLEKIMLESDAFSTSISYSKNSGVQIVRYNDQPYSDEENEILVRFAKVFEQAYIRFRDLETKEFQARKIEAEKERLEKTLSDLQSTQKQLIQSEKMASLGELTAGIAHEIQNPLNFVNNFSEVSGELLEEIDEELANGDLEEVKAILSDIKENLLKINHHGKRADGIVKGMLQHSRSNTGEKELTDINQLAEEYFNLAYHGLRAKEKSFNATMETEFDPKLGKINIVPQEIGRVLLNLINNAFFACNERSKKDPAKKSGRLSGFENPAGESGRLPGIAKYKPTVKLKTARQNGAVTITVEDNGKGMPKEIIDKIFQPFFTTKPTGQGTGLGLSMTYDIIDSHGGKIEVESKQGKGTTFKVQLPAK